MGLIVAHATPISTSALARCLGAVGDRHPRCGVHPGGDAPMKRTKQSGGVYADEAGSFWIRPNLAGKRTWRRLAAITLGDARDEAAALISDHRRSMLGLCRDPFAGREPTVAEAAVKMGRPLEGKPLAAFGSVPVSKISLGHAMEWGSRQTGKRAADIALSQLSVVLGWCHRNGIIQANPLVGRPRLHDKATTRHSREVMPVDGDELHRLGRALLASPRSQGVGWQLLFAALTGCRTNELLQFRMDASGKADPGWIEGQWLYVRRSKRGKFPYVALTPELRECVAAHHAWHASNAGGSRWWFPGADLFRPLSRTALTHALGRISGRKVTAHGLRAYYVTVHRSRGASNEQVAAMIGDKTSSLIETVYGGLPEVWAGGEPLSFMPKTGDPAWSPWTPCIPDNVVRMNA